VDNKEQKGEKPRATRIAVIDNGIMNINPLVNGQPVQNSTNSLASGLSAATDSRTGSKTTPKDGADEKKVDSSQSQGVSDRVVTGQSFLDENYTMGSWSFASDPHGTQLSPLARQHMNDGAAFLLLTDGKNPEVKGI